MISEVKITFKKQKKIKNKFPTLPPGVSELGKIPYFFFWKPEADVVFLITQMSRCGWSYGGGVGGGWCVPVKASCCSCNESFLDKLDIDI